MKPGTRSKAKEAFATLNVTPTNSLTTADNFLAGLLESDSDSFVAAAVGDPHNVPVTAAGHFFILKASTTHSATISTRGPDTQQQR